MLERDNLIFMDMANIAPTGGIEERANCKYIREALESRFPDEKFTDVKVNANNTGKYKRKTNLLEKLWGSNGTIENLPEYYEIEIHHSTGKHEETLIVWCPKRWNDRFAGTAGGGTGIGGRNYITKPGNTSRGWNVPYALMNGFTAATIDAANCRGTKDYILDRNTGVFDFELYENWRDRSTHNMTRFGKAVAEALHDRPVLFSYMNGGSGGGRQSLMEIQNHGADYDGVWASCPAINWHRFLTSGLWPVAVMNEYHHFLAPEKNDFLVEMVHKKYGGDRKFYSMTEKPSADARDYIGMKCKGGQISESDALVMNEIWRGPHDQNGESLWYACYPGCRNWQRIIPIGTYYYPLFSRNKVKPFILGTYHARWITGDPKQNFDDMDFKGFVELFRSGSEKFADSLGDSPDMDEFIGHGGKLIIDHGTDDPLIPVEGTLDYHRKLISRYGAEKVDQFCKLYIAPGDNHGNCWGNGPGITESEGMKALMEWVEKDRAPSALRKVRVDRKTGALIEEGYQKPVEIIDA